MIQEKPINMFPPSEHSDPIRRGLGTQYAINSTSQGQLSVEDRFSPPSSMLGQEMQSPGPQGRKS